MINTNELKRNNWINDTVGNKHENPGYKKVVSISENSINHWQDGKGLFGSLQDVDIDPIPLTPEILEKAGFEKMANTLDWSCYNEKIDHFFFHSPDSRIQTVHQLQNLYFALTGEELNINL